MSRAGSFEARLRTALLAARRSGIRGAGAFAARRGDGLEFSELREYVEGDDPRRIDWAATARAGDLQSRVMLEDRALALAVAIDASETMFVGRTMSNFALACEAAKVWFAVAVDDDRCARPGTRALGLRDVRGRAAAAVCSTEHEARGTGLAGHLRLALATQVRGTRLLAVGDFLQPEAFVPLLRAAAERFDLTVLVARDPWHAGLPIGGFVRLRDAASGRVVSVYVDRAARERFLAAVARREATTLELFRRAGARVGLLDAERGAEYAIARTFGIG
jgi:uncharacterized protein (DUF58 family)